MSAVPKGKGGVDRNALPRYPDGSQWWPPGVARDADDATLAAALRGAWGTPRWVLDLALDVRELLGGPAASLGFDLDAGTRPGTASWDLSRHHFDGREEETRVWNALTLDWRTAAAQARGFSAAAGLVAPNRLRPATIWTNFPFSDPKPWVERAIAAANHCWVSVLAPHTTGAWWDDLEGNALATVRLRRVEFEACPGLLDAEGKPAKGDRPSQQCSLVTLAPPGSRPPAAAIVLAREVPRLGHVRFVVQPGPGLQGC